jgi:NitT/TauT family transport system ATP-binding protein
MIEGGIGEMMEPKITIHGLSKTFTTRKGTTPALKDITIKVNEGEFVLLVGPSGCGKTTLLRILAGLERQSKGEVLIRRSAPDRPLTAMVFQEQSVLPWLTVEANVGYGLRMRGVPPDEQREIVNNYIQLVGLGGFEEAYPHQLSGGMKQRVSVARAFAADPELLLMDEPFASLDEPNKLLLQEELMRIWEGTGKTVVYITHSIEEAVYLGDRIIVLTAGPGSVKKELTVDLPRPRNLDEMRTQPHFLKLLDRVWRLLREEVIKSSKPGSRTAD